MTDILKELDEVLAEMRDYFDDEREVFDAFSSRIRAALELKAKLTWQPIETAPKDKLLVVGWLCAEDSETPERHEFDYIEDDVWVGHFDCVEHAQCVAPAGSRMPPADAPYQWWMDIPKLPAPPARAGHQTGDTEGE